MGGLTCTTSPARMTTESCTAGVGQASRLRWPKSLAFWGIGCPFGCVWLVRHKTSIKESAGVELGNRIRDLGLERPDCYTIKEHSIDHANGTHIFFRGLSVVSEEDIKGLSDVDIVWVEEGHMMSRSSWTLLDPTIRKENAEIWITFNPKNRYDVAWELAQRTDDPDFLDTSSNLS